MIREVEHIYNPVPIDSDYDPQDIHEKLGIRQKIFTLFTNYNQTDRYNKIKFTAT